MHELEDSATDSGVRKRREKSALTFVIPVVIAACVTIIALQASARHWDHSIANILSMIVSLLAAIILAVRFVAVDIVRGHWLRLPCLALVLLGTFATIFKFNGFSGELVPQIGFRFREGPSTMDAVPRAISQIESVNLDDETAVALRAWPQFLGPHRTGTVDTREFDIPNDNREVRVLWRQPIGEGWASFAVQDQFAVTLEQRGEHECLTCYRLADGAVLWALEHLAIHENPLGGIGPRTTPAIHDGKVFAQGATGFIWCVDLNSGEIIWTQDLLKLAGWDQAESETVAPWGRATSPLVIEDLVVMGFGGPSALPAEIQGRGLVALNRTDGSVVWTAGNDQLSYGSPNLMNYSGQPQIVAVNETTVTGHDVKTGAQRWSLPWDGRSNGAANCSQAMRVSDNSFLISKHYGGGSALVQIIKSDDGSLRAEPIWKSPEVLRTKFTHGLVIDDTVYGISDGWLQAVNVSNAQRLWQQPRRSRVGQGQAVSAGDVLIVQDESGDVVFVAADRNEYRELLRLKALEARTWNIPTIAGRHLLVRNDQEAICFLLPSKKSQP
jgi:outer membrane protein assembly factor BamB